MANDWPKVALGAHCLKIGSGATPRGGSGVYLNTGKFSLIRSQNVHNDGFKEGGLVYITEEDAGKLSNVTVKEGDILLNITGDSVARVCMVDANFLPARVNQHVAIIRPSESSFDPVYLRYQLVSPIMQQLLLNLASAGATRNALTKSMIESLTIIKPDLAIQKAIAHILGSLDDKIELNRQMNQTLEAMAQALFKSWFVDFDPVIDNALAAGKPIPDELSERAELRKMVQHGDNQAVRALFPDEFVLTEEMGWIPKGWEISNVGSEVNTVGGATPSTANPEFWDKGEIFWTTPKDLSGKQSKILWDTSKKITALGLKKISSGVLPVDTVLMSSRAPIGYLALAKVPVAINQGYIAMKCEKTLTPEYMIQWTESVMDDIKQRAGGTTFAEISKKSFREIPICVPEKKPIEKYSATVKEFYSKISDLEILTTQLTNIRDTLLPKLLSGELRIPDAAAWVEDI